MDCCQESLHSKRSSVPVPIDPVLTDVVVVAVVATEAVSAITLVVAGADGEGVVPRCCCCCAECSATGKMPTLLPPLLLPLLLLQLVVVVSGDAEFGTSRNAEGGVPKVAAVGRCAADCTACNFCCNPVCCRCCCASCCLNSSESASKVLPPPRLLPSPLPSPPSGQALSPTIVRDGAGGGTATSKPATPMLPKLQFSGIVAEFFICVPLPPMLLPPLLLLLLLLQLLVLAVPARAPNNIPGPGPDAVSTFTGAGTGLCRRKLGGGEPLAGHAVSV